MKDAFETLIKKILAKNPKAGLETGSGGVYGAGKIDKWVNATTFIQFLYVLFLSFFDLTVLEIATLSLQG